MADLHAVENWKHFESNISYLKVKSNFIQSFCAWPSYNLPPLTVMIEHRLLGLAGIVYMHTC